MDDVFSRQNFGNKIGFGERPALVIVDFVVGFADPELFGGGNIPNAIKQTAILLEAFRTGNYPVAFSRVVYSDDGSDAGYFTHKVPGLSKLTETHPASQIVPELAPVSGEYIVRKTQASVFFGTSFAPWLVMKNVDTLVIAGCTTSGCVRATAVDAVSYNFRTIVAGDCVGDRALEPHNASMFDLGMKYADIWDSSNIQSKIKQSKKDFA